MADSAGAGRLHRVLVAVGGDEVVAVPWASRERLLDALRRRDDGEEVISAFEAVGATRPVELDVLGQVVAVETIRAMETKGHFRTGWTTCSPPSWTNSTSTSSGPWKLAGVFADCAESLATPSRPMHPPPGVGEPRL